MLLHNLGERGRERERCLPWFYFCLFSFSENGNLLKNDFNRGFKPLFSLQITVLEAEAPSSKKDFCPGSETGEWSPQAALISASWLKAQSPKGTFG